VFGTTKTLPVDLSFDLEQRGITQTDIYDITNDTVALLQQLNYQITLRYLNLMASAPTCRRHHLHAIASYNWYEVYLILSEVETEFFNYDDLTYDLAQGYRGGLFLSLLLPEHDQRTFISPRGLAGGCSTTIGTSTCSMTRD